MPALGRQRCLKRTRSLLIIIVKITITLTLHYTFYVMHFNKEIINILKLYSFLLLSMHDCALASPKLSIIMLAISGPKI